MQVHVYTIIGLGQILQMPLNNKLLQYSSLSAEIMNFRLGQGIRFVNEKYSLIQAPTTIDLAPISHMKLNSRLSNCLVC